MPPRPHPLGADPSSGLRTVSLTHPEESDNGGNEDAAPPPLSTLTHQTRHLINSAAPATPMHALIARPLSRSSAGRCIIRSVRSPPPPESLTRHWTRWSHTFWTTAVVFLGGINNESEQWEGGGCRHFHVNIWPPPTASSFVSFRGN
jgi:hypothetical protein